MRLNLHPQRCHHGRKDKMAPSSKQEAEEEGEVVMNVPHVVDEEVMNKEEGEVDMVAATTVAEGEEEEISIKEAGQTEGVQEEVATKMVVIEMRASSQVAIQVGYHGGHSGGYHGGGYGGFQRSTYTESGYQGGGYQQDNRYQDGGHHGDRGSGGR